MRSTQTLKLACRLAALIGLTAHGAAFAQPPARAESVTWTVSPPAADVKPGSKVALTLRGEVQPGWHVYSLKQLPLGPTSLVVAVEPNKIATAAGAATGSAPVKQIDPAFRLETQYYDKAFTVTVPVRVGAKLAAGKQSIPVSVRFQTCNGDICQPPKTVHLTAPVNIQAAG